MKRKEERKSKGRLRNDVMINEKTERGGDKNRKENEGTMVRGVLTITRRTTATRRKATTANLGIKNSQSHTNRLIKSR